MSFLDTVRNGPDQKLDNDIAVEESEGARTIHTRHANAHAYIPARGDLGAHLRVPKIITDILHSTTVLFILAILFFRVL